MFTIMLGVKAWTVEKMSFYYRSQVNTYLNYKTIFRRLWQCIELTCDDGWAENFISL